MADIRTFAPGYGTGVTISATTSSSATALRAGSNQIVVTNRDATNAVYVRTGDSAAVATAADYIVLPGAQVPLTRRFDDTHIAVVAAAGTAIVHAIIGDGI